MFENASGSFVSSSVDTDHFWLRASEYVTVRGLGNRKRTYPTDGRSNQQASATKEISIPTLKRNYQYNFRTILPLNK